MGFELEQRLYEVMRLLRAVQKDSAQAHGILADLLWDEVDYGEADAEAERSYEEQAGSPANGLGSH